MKNQDKIKLKDRKVFKFLKEKAAPQLGNVLDIAGDLTGIEALNKVGDLIKGSTELSEDDKQRALDLLNLDLEKFKIEEENKTERWKSDMMSDSWLSKNIRPLTVLNMVILFNVVFIAGLTDTLLDVTYLSLFEIVLLTVLGGYFTIRTIEKRNNKKYK